MKTSKFNILNKKASFEYHLLEEYIVGIQLLGAEIKSIRNKKVSFIDSYCKLINSELYIINMHISADKVSISNYKYNRVRKLLLKKKEIIKLKRKINGSNLTIIPRMLFINDKNYAKLQIFIAKGKKIYDKRNNIRKKDLNYSQYDNT